MQAIEFETQLSYRAMPVQKSLHLIGGWRVRVLLLIDERPVEFFDAIADLFDNPMLFDDFQPFTREIS